MNLRNSSEVSKLSLPIQIELPGNQEVTLASVNSRGNPAFDLIGLTKLRNDPQFAGIDGSGFSIAIIDTGIEKEHPLLASNYITGYDFVENNDEIGDSHGHGTHVAGTAGASDPNIGVATDAGLIGLRVLGNEGTGSLNDVEDSLEWVLANQKKYNITAVNLSFGIGHFTSESEFQGDILSDDIQRLEQAGVTVISATGNNYFARDGKTNQANIAFPAVASTIAVGAVWQDGSRNNFQLETGSKDFSTGADRIASFSQRLDAPNVVFAPGAVINSTVLGGKLGGRAGTSQAAPHVAGVVALMQEASMQFNGRLLTPDEVIYILNKTGDTIIDGDDEDDNVINTNTTYSRINAYNAISEIKRLGNSDIPLPDSKVDSILPEDLNGTIAGARIGGVVDGESTNIFTGTIGKDKTTIGDKDVDIYSFELQTKGLVALEVSANLKDQADFNSYLRLFDHTGNQIAFNDDVSKTNTFSRLDVNLDPGNYYVGVSGSKNNNYDPNIAGSGVAADTGNYRLEFSLSHQDTNGLISSAQSISLGNNLEPLIFAGNIGIDQDKQVGTGDVDLFRIVAPDDGVLFLDIDTPYENDFVDSWLRIFNQSGNELIFAENQQTANNNDSLAFDLEGLAVEFADPNNSNIVLDQQGITNLQSGHTNSKGEYEKGNYGHLTDSFITAQVKKGDVYFVGVSDLANHDYNSNSLRDRPNTGKGGRYELVATFVNENIKDNIDPVSEETSPPISDRNQNNSTDSLSEETSPPISDRNEDNSTDPVREETSTPINDDDLVSGSTVHRFFRTDLGVHFYTANETEKDVIENTLPQFNYEGASFIAPDASADSFIGVKPVYRFLNTVTGAHFYTIDEAEQEFIGNHLDNFNYEGIAYHAYEDENPNTMPVYRFYNADVNAHFYTSDLIEKDFINATLPSYQLEGNNGIAFYVEPI